MRKQTKTKIGELEIWSAVGPPWVWTVFHGNHNLGSFKSFREAKEFASLREERK